MKFDASDVMQVLRAFQIATDDNAPRQVERLEKTQPSQKTTAVYFQFLKNRYAIYVDLAAEDDGEYIISNVERSGIIADYEVLENPSADGLTTYGLPHRGKDIYLLLDKPAGSRLDVMMVEKFGGKSRSVYQKMIKRGDVFVNGVVQTSPKYQVSRDASIIIEAQDIDIEVPEMDCLYEDEHVLVISKPVGMLTHAKGELTDEFTAADFVKSKTTYKADTNRPGVVHRLDRDTSGVLLLVKTEEAASLIGRQFSDRKTKKEYAAVVSGAPKQPQALIDLPIGRNPSAPSTFRVDAGGKSAQTQYEVVGSNETNSLMLLKPRTGRTHQLRVHMQYINTPIVGDRVYGIESSDRMYLHAHKLEVTIPGGQRMTFTAPIPDSFNKFVQ